MAVVMSKRKHSAHSGGREKRASVAPPNAIRRNKIVEEIVDNLRPWNNHKGRDTVTAAVNQALDKLLRLVAFEKEFFDPRPARKHAEKLDKAISKVEMLLLSAPGTLGGYLFDPAVLPLSKVGDSTPHNSSEETGSGIEADIDLLFAELTRLRKVCTTTTLSFGIHPNFDVAKDQSARWAYDVMETCSDRKITGTENQAFRIIASLLHEVVSGQQDADLKRACDAILRRRRRRRRTH
jgi:hypothetical protein